MRRIVARYEDESDASAARESLREIDVEPEGIDVENPFFDPSSRPPEERGLLWGGLIGGVLGAAVLLAMALDVVWIPRLSPFMTAGRLTLLVFGFGLGAAVGGFVGGVWGTMKEIPEPDGTRVAVSVPDHRADEATDRLRAHGPTTLDDAVTGHRPQRAVRGGDGESGA